MRQRKSVATLCQATVAAVAWILTSGCGSEGKTLPPQLEAIRCPEKFSSNTEVRLGTRQISVVCLSEENAHVLGSAPLSRLDLRYLRKADGSYEADANALSGISADPEPAGTYRVLITAAGMPRSFDPLSNYFKHQTIAVVPKIPSELTLEEGFYCPGPGTTHKYYTCSSRLRSGDVHWSLSITLNRQTLQTLDVSQELEDALTLLAAHMQR